MAPFWILIHYIKKSHQFLLFFSSSLMEITPDSKKIDTNLGMTFKTHELFHCRCCYRMNLLWFLWFAVISVTSVANVDTFFFISMKHVEVVLLSRMHIIIVMAMNSHLWLIYMHGQNEKKNVLPISLGSPLGILGLGVWNRLNPRNNE